MTRLQWFLSLGCLGLLLGGAAFFLQGRAAPPRTSSNPLQLAATAPDLPPEVLKFRAGAPLQRVQEFYQTESQRVGQTDPNPSLTQKRLALVAQDLSADEMGWLARQALDATTEGDARFFATYLLALSEREPAVGALSGIALSAVPKRKNERLGAEERMIRAQAVEGISRHCQQPGARDALLDIVEKQGDEFLRDRAHRALYACAMGKPMEVADEAAIRKLQQRR